MGNKGTFDLPVYKTQSTKGARVAYKNMWQREWPHDDDYLRKLAKRVDDEYLPQHDSQKWGKCGTLLNAMRECHVFEEDKPDSTKLAAAFNESGVFKPFTCIGK